jgi:hypothetical protein
MTSPSRLSVLLRRSLPVLALALALGCGGANSSKTTATITSFSPTSGPVGTLINVVGTEFNLVNGASIGGVATPVATNITDTTLTLTVPTAAVTGAVAVSTSGGTTSTVTEFLVQPEITSLSTSTGSASRETPVTIAGSGLMGITSITIGGAAANITYQTANEIIVDVPTAATIGSADGMVCIINMNYGMTNILSPFTVTN